MNRLGSARVGGGRTLIMGVLNASPESFYGGSVRVRGIGRAARALAEQGADVIDVGGMSSAPYLHTSVPAETERRRVVRAVRASLGAGLPVSADTARASVARAALDAGATIINDVSGLKHDPLMREVVSSYSPSLVLCAHGPRAPPGDPVLAARKLLEQSVSIATDAGARRDRMVLDPSIGFFRRSGLGRLHTRAGGGWFARDLEVIRRIGRVGFPVMASVSRKSVVGRMFGVRDPKDRGEASAALEAACVLGGADALRTHDPARAARAASASLSALGRRTFAGRAAR